ncbi:MAG: F0F1 ATP synthase subunit A [Patescibacteria group bacterium]|nr:F0F1 ATP synthase subunit A [Patescibacteria group bacterium]
MEVTLAAEKIFEIGNFPVTNTFITTWIAALLLIVVSFFATRDMKKVPSGLQNFMELVVETLYNQVEGLAFEKAKVFFPWVATFFIFIITANYLGLMPGFGSIGFTEIEQGKEVFVPLLRTINSDLNVTLGLALISVIVTHYYAIKYLGILEYIKKYISLNPIYLFVGLLELVAEFTKILSLSFRLFGNIFAGEALITTISSMAAFVVPLPFMMLELIVGFVQATVFMMLTLVFMVVLTSKHGGEEH